MMSGSHAPQQVDLAAIVDGYDVPIECRCGQLTPKAIGWLRVHRDMTCPHCCATVVVDTSRIRETVRTVERRLVQLRAQLLQQVRKW